jgi:hypothetical protein
VDAPRRIFVVPPVHELLLQRLLARVPIFLAHARTSPEPRSVRVGVGGTAEAWKEFEVSQTQVKCTHSSNRDTAVRCKAYRPSEAEESCQIVAVLIGFADRQHGLKVEVILKLRLTKAPRKIDEEEQKIRVKIFQTGIRALQNTFRPRPVPQDPPYKVLSALTMGDYRDPTTQSFTTACVY